MSSSAPRPAILVLLGVAVVAALFMFMRRGGGDEGTAAPPPAAPSASSTAPAAPGATTTPPATTTPNSVPKPNASANEQKSSQSRELPAKVNEALKAHKVVVVLLWNPRGVDDRSVKSSVDGLSNHGGKVAVFTDKPRNIVRYTKIGAGAGIVQTPTLVVTNKEGEARVATGYLDSTTVEQYVVDALHGAP